MMPLLLWAQVLVLAMLGALVVLYGWLAYRAGDEE
jgi:hypothetical protein